MKKQDKTKPIAQTSNDMNAMDQGLNLFVQTINNVTGLDKGNDGKVNNKK